MDATWRPLEKTYALYLLQLIHDNPGQTKSWIVDQNGRKAIGVKHERLDELVDMGLVHVDEDNRNHNTKLLFLTESGERIVEVLNSIRGDITTKECEPEMYSKL